MKIAFFMDQFPRLTETYFLDQMTGLIREGHEIDIIATAPSRQPKIHPLVTKFRLLERTRYMNLETAFPLNQFKRIIKTIGLVLMNLHKSPVNILKALNFFSYNCTSLDVYLRVIHGAIALSKGNTNYDIVHCHLGQVGLMGVSLRKIGIIKGKIVTTFHSADVYVYPHKWARIDVYQNLWAWTDLCTVCSDYMGNTLQALGAKPNQIKKLPVGLDFSKFIFKERKLEENGVVKIVTVARFVEKKGLEYSIRAVAQACKSSNISISYKIAGEGVLRPVLEQLIEELGMEKQIILLGWCAQPEVTRLLEESHFFILPSVTAQDGNKEGQALVIQEAQAVGLPVISTIHNGIPEGILDGKSGFLVPERNVEAMAEKIWFLVNHPNSWIKMGKAGRSFVEKHYNIDILNKRLLTFYYELLK
jgi:colanic acid/amylovoran biosynthesis glycosyltransferase